MADIGRALVAGLGGAGEAVADQASSRLEERRRTRLLYLRQSFSDANYQRGRADDLSDYSRGRSDKQADTADTRQYNQGLLNKAIQREDAKSTKVRGEKLSDADDKAVRDADTKTTAHERRLAEQENRAMMGQKYPKTTQSGKPTIKTIKEFDEHGTQIGEFLVDQSGKEIPIQRAGAGGQNLPRVTTKADFDKLESGDIFIDTEDGKQYKKP